MQIVVISDTHGAHREIDLPCGDVLVHAGDITLNGEKSVTLDFVDWMSSTSFTHKLFVAGNHDHWAEQQGAELAAYAAQCGVHYLCNSATTIDGVEFWGSPCTPRFMDWSFMLSPGSEAQQHWQQIPENVNVLITHGPPLNILDSLHVADSLQSETGISEQADTSSAGSNISLVRRHVGCDYLASRVSQVAPDFHVFGHIHESYGQCRIGKTQYVNASLMNADYRLSNLPQTFNVNTSLGAPDIEPVNRTTFTNTSAALAVDSAG